MHKLHGQFHVRISGLNMTMTFATFFIRLVRLRNKARTKFCASFIQFYRLDDCTIRYVWWRKASSDQIILSCTKNRKFIANGLVSQWGKKRNKLRLSTHINVLRCAAHIKECVFRFAESGRKKKHFSLLFLVFVHILPKQSTYKYTRVHGTHRHSPLPNHPKIACVIRNNRFMTTYIFCTVSNETKW